MGVAGKHNPAEQTDWRERSGEASRIPDDKGIRALDLDIGYDTDLIKRICLEVYPGRIVTLIGPNGSGKSTLIKTLTGELMPRGGTVFLDGRDRRTYAAPEAAKRVATVLTGRIRPALMTCREVVEAGRYPYTGRLGILTETDKEAVRTAMEWTDVASFADAFYERVSDGQRQRVMLAQAVCREPEILVLDEPTSFLDIRHKLELLKRLRKLAKERGIAVLMSLHELEIAMRVSDQVVALGDGRVQRMGTPGEVFQEDFIRELYDIREMDTAVLGSAPWFTETESGPEEKDRPPVPAFMGTTKARVLMIQGTMSNAGKSVIAAGLCRILHQDGFKAAPFKSQNMALNSFVTDEGLEMGRAQVMQAECAGIRPQVCMNPILLKPTDDCGSQVIVNGRVAGNMRAAEYFRRKKSFIPDILGAYEELSGQAEFIVAEGAGSPVEMNLKKDDIVNMGLAAMLDAKVLLVGDIDRGGIFAQLIGTMDLYTPEERARVQGLIVNRFRGDPALFADGIRILEERADTKVIGVLPWLDIRLDDEDSLSERLEVKRKGLIDIAAVRLPHISNFTDLDPFDQLAEVSVRYVAKPEELGDPDLLILPGSKNTIGDLRWLKETGLAEAITRKAAEETVIFGICGGYQMLGTHISDPLGTEAGGSEDGLGLLPVDTVLESGKVQTAYSGRVEHAGGVLAGLRYKAVEGYEIHMGRTAPRGELPAFTSGGTGYTMKNVFGTYVHGFFDKKEILEGVIDGLCAAKNVTVHSETLLDQKAFKETQYDLLAAAIREHLDIGYIYRIMGIEK